MLWENLFYLAGMVGSPVLLGLSWWGWHRDPRIQSPKWRSALLLSGLCAATGNLIVWWAWVAWLRFHYNPASWRTRDIASDIGLALLLYSVAAAIIGKGRCRILLGISGTLALIPWIPLGVL